MKSTMTKKPHPIDVEVGWRIRQLRQCLKMSQKELGEKIGVTFQQIQKYELGSNGVRPSRLCDIAKALGVEAEAFFPHSGDNKSMLEMIEIYMLYLDLPLGARRHFRGFLAEVRK